MPLKFNTANGAIIVSAEDGSGDAAVTFPRSGYVEPTHTGNVSITGDLTTTGAVDITGDVVVAGEFVADVTTEKKVGLPFLTGTVDIDLENGNQFAGTLYGNTTFTFSNPPPGSSLIQSFTLQLNGYASSYTVTWPSTVRWSGGTAPDAPAAGEKDMLVFLYSGYSWYGFQAGDAMS
jgi:hypothetical protein